MRQRSPPAQPSELDSVKGWRLQLASGASGAGLMYLGRHAWRPKGRGDRPQSPGRVAGLCSMLGRTG